MIWATCTDCGKRSYLSKHAARQARKTLPDRRGLSVYECGNSGFWHVGHLPFAVRPRRCRRRATRPGTEVDACKHRRCVNPSHLEPVTTAENLRRARERSIT